MQTTIVVVIVAVAAFFMARRFYRSVRKDNTPSCGCGCDGCAPNQKQNCTEIQENRE